jgi:regulatory protein
MTERHDAARAALEAALAATSGGPTTPSGGPGATPGRPQSGPAAESDPYDIARQIVLRQLALAPKTRKQLEDKLRQRDCPDDVARMVLDRMAAVGLVDDEAYAGMLVRSQQVGRGLAKRALARELRTKGVDDQIARATLDAIDPEDERERARQLVAKRLRTMHGLDPVVQTRRLAGMLARKGYPPDVSMTVIREAVANAPEHQRD